MRKIITLAAAALLASVFWQSASAQVVYPLRFGVGNPLTAKGEKAAVRIRNVRSNGSPLGAVKTLVSRNMPETTAATGNGYSPTIYGIVIYDNTWTTSTLARGVYSFQGSSTGDNTIAAEVVDNNIFNAASGYGYNGTYSFMGTGNGSYSFYNYNVEDWTKASSVEQWSSTSVGLDLTYDPTTGKVYGVFPNAGYGADHYVFGSVDYTKSYNNVTVIGDFAKADTIVALACNSNGQVYGINYDGTLYSINKDNGQKTEIGQTGVDASTFLQSAAFDPKTGMLYWAATLRNGLSILYKIDPATAEATPLFKFPDSQEVVGLYIPKPDADEKAPAAPTGLGVNFLNANLDGTLSFTMPSTTFDGNDALSGSLAYYIVANNDTIETGTAAPGKTVKTIISLDNGGQTQIKVLARNGVGFGPAVKTSLWVGYDKPSAPASATFQLNELTAQATVKWDAVTGKGVHKGYVDEKNIKYDVIRYPGEVKVGTDLSSTSFSETLPKAQLSRIYYTVVAKNGGFASDTVTSNTITYGDAFEVPYTDRLNKNSNKIGFYTVSDANKDGVTWGGDYSGNIRYSYSVTNAANDWLFTPPIHLQAGKNYLLTFVTRGGYSGTERLAVAYGASKDDVSKYTQLVDTFVIKGQDPMTKKQTFVPSATGDYKFGFHALSDANQYYIYLDSVAVDYAPSTEVPDTISNLTVSPAAKGALKATVSFQAPSKTASGNALASLTDIVLKRGGDTISVFRNPTPGETLTFVDNAPKNGLNTYAVVSSNSEGKSDEIKKTAWIGLDAPLAPKDVKVYDTGDSVRLSWTAPSLDKGIHGGYVDPSTVRYSIYDASNYMQIVKEHITATTYMDNKVHTTESNYQGALYYALNSEAMIGDNEYIEGGETSSDYIRTGTPLSLPYKESVPEGTFENDGSWSENNIYSQSNYGWRTTSDVSADNDKGSLVFTSSENGDYSTWYTPKVSLEGTSNPYFLFSYFAFPGEKTKIQPVGKDNSYEADTLSTITFDGKDAVAGWHRVAYPISKWKNSKYAILGVKATVYGSNQYAIVDNVEIRDVKNNDLTATISAPSQTFTGSPVSIDVIVSNIGLNTAKNYGVSLYNNDKLISTVQRSGLQFTANDSIQFRYTPTAADSVLNLKAVVSYDGDEDVSNNTTATVKTSVKQNDYPSPTGVEAAISGNSVQVSWNAVADEADNTVTETFEDYTPWKTTGIGDWLTVDGDGYYTYGLGDAYPFDGVGYPMAFIVMDNTRWTIDNESDSIMLAAHGGHQYLASFDTYGNMDEGVNQDDDWLISPELSGKEQTISLFAKSVQATYKETFTICYSTGSTDPKDFKVLKTVSGADANWTEYTQQLPAGAKRFAIHNISKKCFALFVDDITYDGKSLKVDHFNIYRDGELVGQAPAGSTSFTYTGAISGTHKYQVSVVYENGESPLSAASVATGIHSIHADGDNASGQYYNLSGERVGTGYRGVVIRNGHKLIKK